MRDRFLNLLIDSYREQYKHREDNFIHVSNLVDFCGREYALCQKYNILYNTKKIVSLGDIITFRMGDLIHDDLRNTLELSGAIQPQDREIKLLSNRFRYPITGSIDGALNLGYPKKIPLEIKSIGQAEVFDALTEPLVNHECQLSLYLWLAEEMKLKKIDYKRGIIVYAVKLKRSMPFKVFEIKRNDIFIGNTIKKLNELKAFSVKGELPKKICSTPHALMARQRCRLPKICFRED